MKQTIKLHFNSTRPAGQFASQFTNWLPLATITSFNTSINLPSFLTKPITNKPIVATSVETSRSNRRAKIEKIKDQRNPYTDLYASHADLINHVDIAISWINHTYTLVDNAQDAQIAQYFTRNAKTKFGQLIHSAAQATDLHSQMMLSEALGSTRFSVSVVYAKANALQRNAGTPDLQKISASDIAFTLAARRTFESGVISSLAKFLNFISTTELANQLVNLRNDLSHLKSGSIAFINAYHQFEYNRSSLIDEILNEEKDRPQKQPRRPKPRITSINRDLLKVSDSALQPDGKNLVVTFEKTSTTSWGELKVSFQDGHYTISRTNESKAKIANSSPESTP